MVQGLTELMRHPAEGEDPVGDTVLVQLLSKWSQRAFSVARASVSAAAVLADPSDTLDHSHAGTDAFQDLSLHSNPNSPADDTEGMGSLSEAGCCKRKTSGSCAGSGGVMPLPSPHQSPVCMHDDPHLAFHISTCAPALVRLAAPHSRGTRAGPAASGVQVSGKREGSEVSGGAVCSAGEDSCPCSHKRRRTEAGCTAGGSPAPSIEQVGVP